ncbi:importin-9-like isoform X1 [Octopus vulgaris]|uniref:Importin-9-like isoform X1 n=1 Tax=Octopus vulgaris TaxID=6645 RepID=A0AA36EYF8_OCTVU|nr:importin-9-like isoform X1 [Octopus vulgaris]
MAGDGDRNKSLKEALIDSLTAILSPLHDVRVNGEEQIKALEVTEEFGVYLAELTVDPNGALAIRQLASVLLKQYVEAHWSSQSSKFHAPETSEKAKAAIREILPAGLKESISKVRTSVAYAVSAITHWDWPETWPELFSLLMEALTCGDPNALHGAMRVLTEFTQDVTDVQMIKVAPVILPEMYKIFVQADTYSIRTRTRAVNIFNTCVAMVATMMDTHKGIVKALLLPVLPQFTDAFISALQVPDGETSDSGLKMEVLQAVTVLVKNLPKTMSTWLPQILPPVWNLFTHSVEFYVRTVVNNTEEADNPVDSDGEVLGFENLVYSVFEFVLGLLETVRFRATVRKSCNEILYYMILYMQITEDQVRLWSGDPDQFVEDEDDDTFSYSVRISAQDLLLSLAAEFPNESAPALCQAFTQHIQQAELDKNAGNPNWWKVHESCLLALGSVRNLFVDYLKKGKLQFDIKHFIESVILADMAAESVSPFLIGRCLWTGSRFAAVMDNETMDKFLQATMTGLHPNQPASVRISAVRAVFGFCEHLKNTGTTQLLFNFLPNIMEGLLTITTQFSSNVLALTLETLILVLAIDDNFTASVECKVTPLTIAVFLKYSSDPLIVSLVEDMVKVLAENAHCTAPLQQRLLPTLISIFQASPDKVPPGLPAAALDVLQMVVRGSKAPLSDALVQDCFPASVQCILQTEDNSTMQSGGECLRAFASVGLDQLMVWQDDHGKNGLFYIIQVIAKLLDPKTPEFTATFVGKLVSVIISKVGSQLGEDLDLMLRSVLGKMQRSETLSVIQSLVMIFAHLTHTQMEALLAFLSNVPGPTGKPALHFVLTEWCSRQHLFYGAYENKVSIIALTKLLQYAVNTNDTRFNEIEVTGDEIIDDSGIRTRSQRNKTPTQWTRVPVLVKIYKLIVNELSNQMETNMATNIPDEDELIDEDEFEEGDDDDDEVSDGTTLSSILEDYGGDGLNVLKSGLDEDEDPDALADPVYHIDLQAYLSEFLQSLSQQAFYNMFSSHHTPAERQVLQAIGIQC